MNEITETKHKLTLRQESLISNPDARVPICIVVDASYSMGKIVEGKTTDTGQREEKDGVTWSIVETEGEVVTVMDKLNEGVRQFYQELLDDPIAKNAAEVALVAFAGSAEIIEDFGPIDSSMTNEDRSIAYTNDDSTSLGKGVDLALQLLEDRKNDYKNAGVEYYQPWLVVLTDGTPTDDTHINISPKITELINNKRITVFPIGIDGADLDALKYISPNRPPIKLKGCNFKELFSWLSKSVSTVSQSVPGDTIPLDKDGIDAWGSL